MKSSQKEFLKDVRAPTQAIEGGFRWKMVKENLTKPFKKSISPKSMKAFER